MSLIVKTVCNWIKAFILLYGIHVVLHGHLTPGGGFAGGVIAASAFVLIMLAQGKQAVTNTFSLKLASTGRSLGALLFWLMAVLGIVVVGTFFVNFWTGFIEAAEVGIGLLVCGSLYLILMSTQSPSNTTTPREKGVSP